MAVKNQKKQEAHLNQLRSWWQERREMIASEYFAQYRDRGKVGVELFSFEPKEGVRNVLNLELHSGIPFLVVRDEATRDTLSVVGDSMGVDSESVLRYLSDPVLDKVDPAVETIFLEQLMAKYPEVVKRFDAAVLKDEDQLYKKAGIDKYSLTVDAVCGNVILDDSIVTPSHLYFHTRGMSMATIESLRDKCLKESESFLKRMVLDGFIQKREYQELLSYTRKGVSDFFHPWTLLRGRLDCQVSNLAEMKGQCSPDIIAKVATWAERSASYSAYVGRQLEDWVKSTSKHYRVNQSKVASERVKLGGSSKKEAKRRPELSKDMRSKVRGQFYL